jgi:hypothetical protein
MTTAPKIKFRSIDRAVRKGTANACHDVAVITPVVAVADERGDDRWVSYIAFSHHGVGQPTFVLYQLVFGHCKNETLPQCAGVFDVVMTLDYADAVSRTDAEKMHEQMIRAARKIFATVRVCDTELAATEVLMAVWPGERSRRMHAQTLAEDAAAAQEPTP